MPWYRKPHWRIIVALVLGLLYGIIASIAGWQEITADWIAPFGIIFLRLLLLIAVPLVLVSLITGIASLSDLNRLSRLGGKTIGVYVGTTVIALIIGLALVNLFRPGETVPDDVRAQLQSSYQEDMNQRELLADSVSEGGPLRPLVDIVPDNIFSAATDNRNMLNMVFIAFLFGTALVLVPKEKSRPVLELFSSIDVVIVKIVELVIIFAPIGVFALIADTITSVSGDNPSSVVQLLGALWFYSIVVLAGLAIQMFVTYPILLKLFTPIRLKVFFRGIVQAQLVAFSTSSSAATLPVTKKNVQKNLGVSDEVASFVLPLGATINMDGTALYQAIAAVFIAQTVGIDLDLSAQLTIIAFALLASIGTAGVPSAGIVMLIIILEAVGVPLNGIALILGVDRILDMCRTVVNITGDASVATVVAASEGQIRSVDIDC